MEEMREQSLQEGSKGKAIESAKRMLADGVLSLEKIAEYVGLNLDEAKKLQAAENAYFVNWAGDRVSGCFFVQ